MNDPAEKNIWCAIREQRRPLLGCPDCRHFPCRSLRAADLAALRNSDYTKEIITGLLPRREKMFIFKDASGALRVAPAEFSPEKFDEKMLEDVEEVYCISKVLVKQTRLVVKDREERKQIREDSARSRKK